MYTLNLLYKFHRYFMYQWAKHLYFFLLNIFCFVFQTWTFFTMVSDIHNVYKKKCWKVFHASPTCKWVILATWEWSYTQSYKVCDTLLVSSVVCLLKLDVTLVTLQQENFNRSGWQPLIYTALFWLGFIGNKYSHIYGYQINHFCLNSLTWPLHSISSLFHLR